ncbi:MAG: MarR family transcriptional regulator [Pleurocapsa sp. MO_226.B13]|nr:MarR family transcriptional regulator [Pleurocapsa sp. MO_226.B13]
MSTKKVQGKFYPLQHQEFLKLNQILTQSELAVYLWLKTNDPFGSKFVEADTQKIAEDLGISRRSVQRALVKLQQEELIELVINKFKYRLKSKLLPQSENNSEIKDDSQVATSRSPDDSKIVSTTSVSLQRHQDRSDDNKIVSTTPASPSSSETYSVQKFQNPKIFKTYIDFKRSLSEEESENFFKFVKEEAKNLNRPINDLEAWLASETKAGQNRWEVYYQNYQERKKADKPESEINSTSKAFKQKAIAKYQEYLKQQRSESEKIDRGMQEREYELESLLNNPDYQIKSSKELESQSKQTPKALGKYIAEGKEKLRDLRMTNYFADLAVQGGLA